MFVFRTEDRSNSDGVPREYKIPLDDLPRIKKQDVDKHIAEKIKNSVNGSKKRDILNYSKSLSVCLLKYNKRNSNELHICDVDKCDIISYYSPKGKIKEKNYLLRDRVEHYTLFKNDKEIQLLNFVIDISNNTILNKYLIQFTSKYKGLKAYASPEKDYEVVMMQADNDLKISANNLHSVYVLFALQLKYSFLCDYTIMNIKQRIQELQDTFEDEKEKDAFLILILHLYFKIDFERDSLRTTPIYEEDYNLDSISLFEQILNDDFKAAEAYSNYYFPLDVLSLIIFDECQKYLINLIRERLIHFSAVSADKAMSLLEIEIDNPEMYDGIIDLMKHKRIIAESQNGRYYLE